MFHLALLGATDSSIMQFKSCASLTGALTAVTEANCATILQQVRRVVLQKKQASPSFSNATIATQATWTTPLAASDDTKIVAPSNKLFSPEFTATEPVRVGSNDNTTPDGRSFIVGQSVPMLNAQYMGLSPTQYKEFEDLLAFANVGGDISTVWAYFFLGDRQIVFAEGGGGIDIMNAFISDPAGGQLHSLTLFNATFELPKGWYRNAKVLDLSFNHSLIKN
ncbi:hypothetical protein GCM10027347_52450 [Larkinella harenae]